MGVANLLSIVAPLYLMCSPRAISGVVYQVKAPITDKPTLFLYDTYPRRRGLERKSLLHAAAASGTGAVRSAGMRLRGRLPGLRRPGGGGRR